MQTRFTARGVDGEGKDVILAFELKEEVYQVDLYITPKAAITIEQAKALEEKWVEGEQFDFPETSVFVNPNLNDDSILPVDIKSEEAGKIRAKQNEWAYRLLTNKLWESYIQELADLKKKAAELTTYSRNLFDDVKGFWERVLEHKKERDISQSNLEEIKAEVNKIFELLKELRKNESAQFETASSQAKEEVIAQIEHFKSKLVEGAMFKELFEELKQLQQSVKGKRLSKSDDNVIRKAFDAAFQHLSEARNSFANNKNASRIENLTKIVASMEKSLQRDKSDLEYYTKKMNNPKANALELQLVKVKLNMLKEAVSSKEEKITDIYKTLTKLQAPKRKSATVAEKNQPQTEEGASSPAANTLPDHTAAEQTTAASDVDSEQEIKA